MIKEKLQISKTTYHKEELALAIGFFDGLHLGHQTLIKEVVSKKGYLPAILTFERNFKSSLNHSKEELLLTKEEEEKMLQSLSIKKEFILPFDEETMHTSKEDFLLFLRKLNPRYIVVGKDFSFGDKASGKAEDLYSLSKYGITIIIKNLLNHEGEKISSTRIKDLLRNHEIEQADKELGYPFFIQGEVIHGLENGRRIGFPTANMNYPKEKVVLPSGVYQTKVEIDDKTYYGMTNIGNHPTIDALKENIVETNVIGYQGDLYGKTIKVSFLRYLRDQRKFASLKDLRSQLEIDLKEAEKE